MSTETFGLRRLGEVGTEPVASDAENITAQIQDSTLTGAPGETVTHTIRLHNHSTVIGTEPDACTYPDVPGALGINVKIQALIEYPPVEVAGETEVCVPDSGIISIGEDATFSFQLPDEPGNYELLYVLTLPEANQAVTNLGPVTLTVEGPTNGNGGGPGDDPGDDPGGSGLFGLSDAELFALAGVTVGVGMLALRSRDSGRKAPRSPRQIPPR